MNDLSPIRAAYAEWAAGVDASVRTALARYCQLDHARLNQRRQPSPATLADITALQSAVLDCPAPSPLLLFRGLDAPSSYTDWLAAWPVGTSRILAGFQSCSLLESVAVGYSGACPVVPAPTPVLLEFELSGGEPAAFIDVALNQARGDTEVLLPRDACWRLRARETRSRGRDDADVCVGLPPGAPTNAPMLCLTLSWDPAGRASAAAAPDGRPPDATWLLPAAACAPASPSSASPPVSQRLRRGASAALRRLRLG